MMRTVIVIIMVCEMLWRVKGSRGRALVSATMTLKGE